MGSKALRLLVCSGYCLGEKPNYTETYLFPTQKLAMHHDLKISADMALRVKALETALPGTNRPKPWEMKLPGPLIMALRRMARGTMT
jgi:hypothetical protein